MDNQKTGALIARRRQELGLTQKELADRLNVSDRTVSKWERGAGFPDVSLLEPLADALGLSVLELIRGERRQLLPPRRNRPSGKPAGSWGAGSGGPWGGCGLLCASWERCFSCCLGRR